MPAATNADGKTAGCTASPAPTYGSVGWVTPRGVVALPAPHDSSSAPDKRRRCRHCYADIEQLPSGAWADVDGFMRCVKYVNHEPLEVLTDGRV